MDSRASGDALTPVLRQKLPGIGGTMTMLPREPHLQVSGCMHNLTGTTQVQVSKQALPVSRVLGYYYRKLLAIGHTSLSCVLPLLTGRYVSATSHRLDRAPTHEAKRAV
jgi:hypothetical protein